MVHQSENSSPLTIYHFQPANETEFLDSVNACRDVCLVRLPSYKNNFALDSTNDMLAKTAAALAESATLIIIGEIPDLVHIHATLATAMRFQLWIAIKREPVQHPTNLSALPNHHIAAVVYTKYNRPLEHTKTRLAYTYCPACQKTTKDYGGKKHTYHPYGTLISDVWRDITLAPDGNVAAVAERFADLFGLAHYEQLWAYDLRQLFKSQVQNIARPISDNAAVVQLDSQLLNGDCLAELQKLPSNSIDFAFADPPYNLKKVYIGYADDMKIAEYFAWCDRWINEVARVLRPGGTFALLNIPLWSIRHFLHLETVLSFQNWIVWDALSFPVRMIMPAHYTILCFSKGTPRPLPGLKAPSSESMPAIEALKPLAEGFCLRAPCIADRSRRKMNDRGQLTDIWSDIHRLKHNSRRVDHPCQLPPQLLYRLITLFTQKGELVLDCFNGAGTSTLTAHQLGRRYIGIEHELKYHELACMRHHEIEQGIDPFRKEERVLTAKNSPVARLKKQKYAVPKKTLQLEVRRVAELLNKLPSREEMITYGEYPIQYYDEYFSSWGEVCAAARTTGMKETQEEYPIGTFSQKRLF